MALKLSFVVVVVNEKQHFLLEFTRHYIGQEIIQNTLALFGTVFLKAHVLIHDSIVECDVLVQSTEQK